MGMSPLSPTYGHRIRQLRTDRGLSQYAFAELVGIERTAICAMERGNRVIGAKTIVRIAHRLGIDIIEELRLGGYLEEEHEQKTDCIRH